MILSLPHPGTTTRTIRQPSSHPFVRVSTTAGRLSTRCAGPDSTRPTGCQPTHDPIWHALHRAQNISQLPGFGDPPNPTDLFMSTTKTSYQQQWQSRSRSQADTPRAAAALIKERQERTDIFGTASSRAPPTEPTTASLFRNGKSMPRKVNPRFVHGGAFRGHSNVALGKNLTGPWSSAPDYSTTQASTHSWHPGAAKQPTHRYDLPQKNTSTHLTTSMVVAESRGESHRPRTGDWCRPSQTNFRSRVGPLHYTTAHATHFTAHPEVRRVPPPGKGGVDVSGSDIPLGSLNNGDAPTPATHSHDIFQGAQPPDGLRHTCASRGTLGTHGGRKLPRSARA